MQSTLGNSKLCDARVYGLSPVLLKIIVFWDVTLCQLIHS